MIILLADSTLDFISNKFKSVQICKQTLLRRAQIIKATNKYIQVMIDFDKTPSSTNIFWLHL